MAKDVNHAHAVYVEFHNTDNNGQVSQLLFISAGASGGEFIPARLMARLISPESPQSQWRKEIVKMDPITLYGGKLARSDRPEFAITYAVEAYSTISTTLEALSSFKWDLYKEPLVMQVGPLDLADLRNGTTPKKLIDRVRNLRDANGWEPLPAGAPKGAKAGAK